MDLFIRQRALVLKIYSDVDIPNNKRDNKERSSNSKFLHGLQVIKICCLNVFNSVAIIVSSTALYGCSQSFNIRFNRSVAIDMYGDTEASIYANLIFLH
ncbi:hypothetical protein J7J00_02020 [Bacillus sp. ISL-4]|uniref:hypothetical protein n=1 Tax=Bacillus sp. ISL-4 TaxID=2819125 RepID=UPI001BE7B2C6|nr:hypothetical protein [Bacillus sp. ISL-4]MBT2664287.1 hypothetical protein [Bacillus sp. ISL-4]MBT2669314.1 hypothetical protein [Streptomyces sp. ISL-14]